MTRVNHLEQRDRRKYQVEPSDSSLPNSQGLPKLEAQLQQLMAQLPENTLALFGHEPVRSHPYPTWPVFDHRDIIAITEVVRSGQWGGTPYPGQQAAQFSQQFAELQTGDRSYPAVPVVNGSLTLEVAIRAANIGWGDEVIVPAYTFQATAAAPMAAGAIPVIVDVDPLTYCISPEAIETAITPRTRAIIPVHLGAQMADMDAIKAIAQRHGLVVIEDCAHAHGATWKERGAGTFGDFGSFSFQSSKVITAGEGGMLLCRTLALAQRAMSIVDCGRAHSSAERDSAGSSFCVSQLTHFIQHGTQEPALSMGINYRLAEPQAALGRIALERFSQQQSARAAMMEYFESRLEEVLGIRRLNRDERLTQRPGYRYICAIEPEAFGATHDEVSLALQAEGIPCSTGYPALHQCGLFQPLNSRSPVPSAFPERFQFESLHLPVAEQACGAEALWFDQSVFRAGRQGVDSAIAALKKVQQHAPLLAAAKAAFLQQLSNG